MYIKFKNWQNPSIVIETRIVVTFEFHWVRRRVLTGGEMRESLRVMKIFSDLIWVVVTWVDEHAHSSCSILKMNVLIYTLLYMAGHSGSFHFLATVSNAGLNVSVQISLWDPVFIFGKGVDLEKGLWDYISLFFFLKRTSILFSIVVPPFYNHINSAQGVQFLHVEFLKTTFPLWEILWELWPEVPFFTLLNVKNILIRCNFSEKF